MEKSRLIRVLKNNYKVIGVIVLALLLVISTIVNIRLMTNGEAKEIARAGGYEQYADQNYMYSVDNESPNTYYVDYSEDDYNSENVNSSENVSRSNNHNNKKSNKKDIKTKGKQNNVSAQTTGNNLQNLDSDIIREAATRNENTKPATKSNEDYVNKYSGIVTTGNNKDSAGSTYKPKESTEEGERAKLSEFIGEAFRHTGDRYLYVLYQEPNYSSPITVTVQVDYLSIFEPGVTCNDERFADRLNTDGYILHPVKIACYQGENCWDAVARALIENDIQYTCDAEPFRHGYSINNKYGTCYLTCCDNMYTGDNSNNKSGPFGTTMSGWTYTVTNKQGRTVYPGLGMNGVLIKDGDTICLKYHNGLSMFEMDEYGDF